MSLLMMRAAILAQGGDTAPPDGPAHAGEERHAASG